MQSRKLNPIPLLLITVVFIGLMYLLISGKKKPPKADDAIVNKLVTATQAQIKAHQPMIDIFGTVESTALQTVSSPISSYVERVTVKAGEAVEQGAVLVTLETDDLSIQRQGLAAQLQQLDAQLSGEKLRYEANQQALNSERELLALTQVTMNNAKTLYERGLGAKNPYDQAKQQVIQLELSIQSRELAVAQYQEAVAQIRAQKKQIQSNVNQVALNEKRARVTADQDSQIVSVMVAEGELVSVGQPLLSSYNPESLQVKALMPQKHLAALRTAKGLGETVFAKASVEQQPVMLSLSRFANVADAQHGGVEVFFDIVSGRGNLQVNRNLEMQVMLPAENDVIALPVEALHAGNRIYRISAEHKLQSVPVDVVGYIRNQTDSASAKQMLVRAPAIQAGDRIMTAHLTDALEGQVVDMNIDGQVIAAPEVKRDAQADESTASQDAEPSAAKEPTADQKPLANKKPAQSATEPKPAAQP